MSSSSLLSSSSRQPARRRAAPLACLIAAGVASSAQAQPEVIVDPERGGGAGPEVISDPERGGDGTGEPAPEEAVVDVLDRVSAQEDRCGLVRSRVQDDHAQVRPVGEQLAGVRVDGDRVGVGPRGLVGQRDAAVDRSGIIARGSGAAFEKAWLAHVKRQPFPRELIPWSSEERKELKEESPGKKGDKKRREISFGDFAASAAALSSAPAVSRWASGSRVRHSARSLGSRWASAAR